MRRKIMALLLATIICTIGTSCGSTNAETATEKASTEGSVEDEVVTAENAEETITAIDGIWQTASMVPGDDDEVQPEYYVRFTDSEIQYGHMNGNDFVLDHSDTINHIEQMANGGYKIQSESSNGVQYTFQTNEDDNNMLEYFETWNEDEFAEKYSGGASLFRLD